MPNCRMWLMWGPSLVFSDEWSPVGNLAAASLDSNLPRESVWRRVITVKSLENMSVAQIACPRPSGNHNPQRQQGTFRLVVNPPTGLAINQWTGWVLPADCFTLRGSRQFPGTVPGHPCPDAAILNGVDPLLTLRVGMGVDPAGKNHNPQRQQGTFRLVVNPPPGLAINQWTGWVLPAECFTLRMGVASVLGQSLDTIAQDAAILTGVGRDVPFGRQPTDWFGDQPMDGAGLACGMLHSAGESSVSWDSPWTLLRGCCDPDWCGSLADAAGWDGRRSGREKS